jgi:hypothetical protein
MGSQKYVFAHNAHISEAASKPALRVLSPSLTTIMQAISLSPHISTTYLKSHNVKKDKKISILLTTSLGFSRLNTISNKRRVSAIASNSLFVATLYFPPNTTFAAIVDLNKLIAPV